MMRKGVSANNYVVWDCSSSRWDDTISWYDLDGRNVLLERWCALCIYIRIDEGFIDLLAKGGAALLIPVQFAA